MKENKRPVNDDSKNADVKNSKSNVNNSKSDVNNSKNEIADIGLCDKICRTSCIEYLYGYLEIVETIVVQP